LQLSCHARAGSDDSWTQPVFQREDIPLLLSSPLTRVDRSLTGSAHID
jgi:hypothetical protein